MRRLILHIGYPKTGTTTLQRFLAANAARLARAGVLYPEAGRLGDAHYGVNFALDIADYDRPAHVPKAADIAADIAAEAEGSGCATVVLSSEYLITARPPQIDRVKAAFAGYEVRVLCYLRRHDLAFESAYLQALKTVPEPPWGQTIEAFVLYHQGAGTVSYDYLGVLRTWAARFGREALVVRPFEAAQNRPDLAADFLAAAGIPDRPEYERPAPRNTALSARTAAAIGVVWRTGLDPDLKRRAVGRLVAADPPDAPRPSLLAPPLRAAIVQRHLPMYAQIAREFLGRADGTLFAAPLPTPRDPWEPPPAETAETLVETILRAILAPR